MLASVADLHMCAIGGAEYWFRTPTHFDVPHMRRDLTRQGVRYPSQEEIRLTALAGIAALGEASGEPAETERQKDVLARWYELLAPLTEDDIDEPDFEKRAEQLAALQAERKQARIDLIAEVGAIEANLQRHWLPYADLLADRNYWNDMSAIGTVRTLLVRVGDTVLRRDPDGMLKAAEYDALPRDHLPALEAFAIGLMAPDEATRKN